VQRSVALLLGFNYVVCWFCLEGFVFFVESFWSVIEENDIAKLFAVC
jgi:hypothetical protein